jgi:Flagellar assembly protein T, C-terminal domain
MTEEARDDRLMLRWYLLGLLSQDDGDRVEDQFGADEAYFSLYQDVERGLVRDYAAANLSPEDAARFERNYLITAERQRQVILVRALLSIQAETAPASRARKLSARNLPLVFATAALVAAGVFYVSRQAPFAAPSMARRKPPAPADRSANADPSAAAPTPQAVSEMPPELAGNRGAEEPGSSNSHDGRKPGTDALPSFSTPMQPVPASGGQPSPADVRPTSHRVENPKASPEAPAAGEPMAAEPAGVAPRLPGQSLQGRSATSGRTPIHEMTARPPAGAAISGLVADISPDGTLAINLGSRAGVRVGDRLTIMRRVPEVQDALTGQATPAIDGLVGQITITELQEDSSVGSFSGPGKPQVGDVVVRK